jgi:hypothetical protein
VRGLQVERGQKKREDFQVRDQFEVAFVSSTHRITKVESGDADQQIRKRNDDPLLPGFLASASILAASCPISLLKGSTAIEAKTVLR